MAEFSSFSLSAPPRDPLPKRGAGVPSFDVGQVFPSWNNDRIYASPDPLWALVLRFAPKLRIKPNRVGDHRIPRSAWTAWPRR
jgi:hypothetical protein